MTTIIFTCLAALSSMENDGIQVRGMTISSQTWGQEWGSDDMGRELDELKAMGVNWISIHPYATIRADGAVGWQRFDPDSPPAWLTRPIAEAHARGMSILIKPHIAYWRSKFTWRGDIDFPDDYERQRFFAEYEEWISALARATKDADAFAIGCELDKLLKYTDHWRGMIARVRKTTPARLTYAANWTDYERVPFWNDLDAVGVQGYFPLAQDPHPTREQLEAGWQKVVSGLRRVHRATGKPVVFTELGYDASPKAAHKPWEGRWDRPRGYQATEADRQLQARCMAVALQTLEREKQWLRGAFLWKWFVGDAPGHDFQMDSPHIRQITQEVWGARTR